MSNKIKETIKGMFKNPVAFTEMNAQQKQEYLIANLKRDLITAIQCMSVVYRSPEMLDAIATGIQNEMSKPQEDGSVKG